MSRRLPQPSHLLNAVLICGLLSGGRAQPAPPRSPEPAALVADNSLGLRFVPVPGTDTLFSVWHVRVQDFQVFLEETKYAWQPLPRAATAPAMPVVGVSWQDARAFCAWLTGKERAAGRLDAAREYRLPTDAEWSIAVGLPDEANGYDPATKAHFANKRTYPWGDAWPPPAGAGNFSDEFRRRALPAERGEKLSGYDDGYADASPVGSFAATRLGLFDMGGNVRQWCEDSYGGAMNSLRVVRGSSFLDGEKWDLHSSRRHAGGPDERFPQVGFRCVLGPPVSKSGSVEVQSIPRGLPFVLASTAHRTRGITPAKLSGVPPGTYLLIVSRPGSPDFRGTITAWPDDGKFRIPFVANLTSTELAVTSNPTGAEVWEQDRLLGKTPLALTHVTPGPFALEVRAPGFVAATLGGEVKPHATTRVTATLQPANGGPLEITSTPSGAEILCQGKRLGVTPLSLDGLAPGAMDLEFRLERHVSATAPANVRPNTATRVAVTLAPFRPPAAGQPWTVETSGMVLMPVAPGTFQMGASDNEKDDVAHPQRTAAQILLLGPIKYAAALREAKLKAIANELPRTKVTLTRAFWLGRHDVTDREWNAVMGPGRRLQPSGGRVRDNPNLPVDAATWSDAMEFCAKLTERERAAGRLPAGLVYTLPTEAQWEYACRAGTTGSYSGKLDEMGWYQVNPTVSGEAALIRLDKDEPAKHAGDSGGVLHPVGQKRPNAWGLYDMHGNVRQWCLDRYANRLPGGSVTDPTGPAEGGERVLRGGSYWSEAFDCRSASRLGSVSTYGAGFRVALAAGNPEATAAAAASGPPPPAAGKAAVSRFLPGPDKTSLALEAYLQPEPDKPWENTLGMKFVPVPGTRVLFSIWDTRNQDFRAFIKDAGKPAWKGGGDEHGPAHPAVLVSRREADLFCRWLTSAEQKAGRLLPGQKYRLPTAAEWTVAAGWPPEELASAAFPWGTQWPPPPGSGNFSDASARKAAMRWSGSIENYEDGFAGASPVGSFVANRFGLYDLLGNVWQWCGDPDGPDLLRGGSFQTSDPAQLAATYRPPSAGDREREDWGFRCVLEAVPASF